MIKLLKIIKYKYFFLISFFLTALANFKRIIILWKTLHTSDVKTSQITQVKVTLYLLNIYKCSLISKINVTKRKYKKIENET